VNELPLAKTANFGCFLVTSSPFAGSLYHERADAAQYAAWGVDYLKYDDCGEANIQSYAKYFVMKDALDAAYSNSRSRSTGGGDGGGGDGVGGGSGDGSGGSAGGAIDYYSYEPFQVYGQDAISQMSWVAGVGDLWRTGADLRPSWSQNPRGNILTNAFVTNSR
jgi:hypothetical protein